MTLGIVDNLTASFEFAKDGLVDHWTRWILLILLTCIPVVNFITSFIVLGYLVKIYKGGDIAPELEGYGEMFINGIIFFIIQFVYVFIPIILMIAGVFFAGTGVLALLAGSEGEAAVAGVAIGAASGMTGLLLILVGIVLAIIFGLIAVIAGIRFAKTERFGEGFNFGEILATVKKVGLGHYILSYIVFLLVGFIIALILGLIPFIGWLLTLVIIPPLILLQGKFFENLYSCA